MRFLQLCFVLMVFGISAKRNEIIFSSERKFYVMKKIIIPSKSLLKKSIAQSVREMILVKKGKLIARPVQELLNELSFL